MTEEEKQKAEFDKLLNSSDEFDLNAGDAYEQGNEINLAISMRGLIEQFCNITFFGYVFEKEVTLKDKIDYLEAYNILNEEEVSLLHSIRENGNAAAHGKPLPNDPAKLYARYQGIRKNLEEKQCNFLGREDRPMYLNPIGVSEPPLGKYKFCDCVWGASLFQSVTVYSGGVEVKSKDSGQVSFNEITNVGYQPATALKKGLLYFYIGNQYAGVTWSTLTQNAKMNEDAKKIAEFAYAYAQRNKKKANAPSQQITNNNITYKKSAAEEVLDLKKLLDAGIITEEEFERKKKELLNL